MKWKNLCLKATFSNNDQDRRSRRGVEGSESDHNRVASWDQHGHISHQHNSCKVRIISNEGLTQVKRKQAVQFGRTFGSLSCVVFICRLASRSRRWVTGSEAAMSRRELLLKSVGYIMFSFSCYLTRVCLFSNSGRRSLLAASQGAIVPGSWF